MHRPLEKTTYHDIEDRELTVQKVDLKNNLDRHIQGRIAANGNITDYSCSLQIWADIWRDRAPRLDPNKMKIG
jgi:hypothetical protein